MAKKDKSAKKAAEEARPARKVQAREVVLLDELGRFFAGTTAQGIPLTEPMVAKKGLEMARALIASRNIPPGTFLSSQEGDAHVIVYGGDEFFGAAAQDAGALRELPHELAAVVEAFEKAVAEQIDAGGLSRAAMELFPQLALTAMADPARFSPPPVGPLAFARAQFRPSGTRLALDIEVINDTPWVASRVEVRLHYDTRALPLVSVKARVGGFAAGVLTLPPVPARSRDRAVILFEPRQPGTHLIEGELVLGLDGGGERRAKIRRARTTVGKARVVATVPKTLRDFRGLIEGRLRYSAPLELAESLGGLATVAGLATEVEKDDLAKVLDWHGASGEREVWYLGLGGGPERPILVQLTQAETGRADVVVAAAKRADLLAYSAQLRARLDMSYAGAPTAQLDVKADEAPEVTERVPRAVVVAQQISADLGSGDMETTLRRPQASTAMASSSTYSSAGGRSAGDELVPGLIDALERSFAVDRMLKRK